MDGLSDTKYSSLRIYVALHFYFQIYTGYF